MFSLKNTGHLFNNLVESNTKSPSQLLLIIILVFQLVLSLGKQSLPGCQSRAGVRYAVYDQPSSFVPMQGSNLIVIVGYLLNG